MLMSDLSLCGLIKVMEHPFCLFVKSFLNVTNVRRHLHMSQHTAVSK